MKIGGHNNLDVKNTFQKEMLTPAQWLSVGGILLFFGSYKKILFGEFLYGMCSSHQDCYVHQFSDDYVDVRFQLYRSKEKSAIAT